MVQIYMDRLRAYLLREKYFLFYCLAITIIAFGFEIFNISISIDEEVASVVDQPMKVWLSMDRWGMYLLNAVFHPGPPLPFFHFSMGLIANLVAFLIAVHIWDFSSRGVKYIAAIPALSYPSLSFTLTFNQSQYGYFVGLVLAVLAVYAFIRVKHPARRYLLVTGMLMLSISIYQSTVLAAPVVFCIYLFEKARDAKNLHRYAAQFGQFMLLLVAGVVLHEVLSGLIRQVFDVTSRYQRIENVYSGEFLQSYDPLFVIREISAVLLGQRWYIGWIMGFLVGISIVYSFALLWLRKSEVKDKLVRSVFLGTAILAPFVLVIATGRIWPMRTFVALPLLVAGLITLLACYLSRRHLIFLGIYVACCFVHFVHSNTRLFYSDYMVWEQQKLLVNRVASYLENHHGETLIDSSRHPIVFVGVPTFAESHVVRHEETFGAPIFHWDTGGNNNRIIRIFSILGIDYFRRPNKSEIFKGRALSSQMTNWPARGSVQFQDGIFIIRFSEPTD